MPHIAGWVSQCALRFSDSTTVILLLRLYTNPWTRVHRVDSLESRPDLNSRFATPWTLFAGQVPLLIPRWRDRDSHGPLQSPVQRPGKPRITLAQLSIMNGPAILVGTVPVIGPVPGAGRSVSHRTIPSGVSCWFPTDRPPERAWSTHHPRGYQPGAPGCRHIPSLAVRRRRCRCAAAG